MAVHAIAVIGAGAMGSGIAQVAAVAGLGVTLIEVSDAAVEKGLDRVRGNLQKGRGIDDIGSPPHRAVDPFFEIPILRARAMSITGAPIR